MNQEVFAALTEALERGEEVALVTIAASTGSTPQRVGAKMLVYADGRTVGHDRRRLLRERRVLEGARGDQDPPAAQREVRAQRRLRAGDRAWCAAGRWKSSSSRSSRHRSVYVFGAGHVGYFVGEDGARGRASACTSSTTARSSPTPSASATASTSSSTTSRPGCEHHQLPPTAYAVIVTRGHTHDLDALRALAADAAPLSRPDRQQGQGEADLRRAARGRHAAEALRGVHAPIGLDIGAITPQEIAVSIVAELIAVKHGKIAEPERRRRQHALGRRALQSADASERIAGSAGPSDIIEGRAKHLTAQWVPTNSPNGRAALLATLVREYIETGEPVSSQVLARESGLGVSSATVRNVLAQLEEAGYVHQPHTSAGRVPTDRGYRVFVDLLLESRKRRLAGRQRRDAAARSRPNGRRCIDDLLASVSHLVSRAARHVGFALADNHGGDAAAHRVRAARRLARARRRRLARQPGHAEGRRRRRRRCGRTIWCRRQTT